MLHKTSLLTFVLAGVICSVSWLSADEPVKPPQSESAADVDVNALLKRIEQLEHRVTELEAKLARPALRGRVLINPPNVLTVPQPDSPALKNLPPHEINGIRYYHVPLKGREK